MKNARDVLYFVVPMPLNIANARLHWAKRDKARRAYFASLDQRQAAGLLPPPPKRPIARAAISSDMVLHQRMDQDNAVARHKWLLDWLQSRGYVENDKRVEWAAFPRQSVRRNVDAKIVITVTPL